MPRVLDATCLANIVTCEGVPVTGVTVLSEGVSQSSGYLIIDEDKTYYVAKTSPDLKAAITTLNSMLTSIANMFLAVDLQFTAMSAYGGVAVNTAALVTFNTNNTTFGLTKDMLK